MPTLRDAGVTYQRRAGLSRIESSCSPSTRGGATTMPARSYSRMLSPVIASGPHGTERHSSIDHALRASQQVEELGTIATGVVAEALDSQAPDQLEVGFASVPGVA